MPEFFIRRPLFAIVISLILIIVGTISALQLPIAQYPPIAPPSIYVYTDYAGASAEVLDKTVAQVIEQQVNGTQGIDYMQSSSDDAGSYVLKVVFKLDTDGDMDSVKVQNNVAVANTSLPTDVQTAGVTTMKASEDMALLLTLYSPEGTYDATFMDNYAQVYLLDRIRRISGIGRLEMLSTGYAMRVWLNPDKMAQLGITIPDVTKAVNAQNKQVPVGVVGKMPVDPQQEMQYTGKTKGRLITTEDFANVIVRKDAAGGRVYLKDIARIEAGPKTSNYVTNLDGREGVAFYIQLTNDANAMQTIQEVQQVIADAKKDFPPDLDIKELVNTTDFISESLHEVLKTFGEALLLVMLIIFLFLQSWRATLIAMLAVPVSLVATFIAFHFLGFSINTLTLFAMVLAIGLVVDDAIVVIENVERHMQTEGIAAQEAAIRAMREVQGPVVAIACVLAAVFVPVAFLGGMMGMLYKQFALTIAISMGLSAFVALSLTPALCGLLLKPHAKARQDSRMGRLFIAFNRRYLRVQRKYIRMAVRCIAHLKLVLPFLLVVTGLIVLLYDMLPSTFIPEEDQGYYFAAMHLPEGTSMNRTVDTTNAIVSDLQKQSGVRDVLAISGFDILSNGSKANAATFFVALQPWAERQSAEQQIDAVVETAMKTAGAYPEAFFMAMNPPSLPGLGMVGGFELQLLDVSGHTDAELDAVAKRILAAAKQRPELMEVSTTYQINSPGYEFEIDREKVQSADVDLDEVFTALQVNFGGSEICDFNRFGRTYKVVVQSDKKYRSEADAAKFVFVRNSAGAMVPLDTLLSPRLTTAPSVISRFNGVRSVVFQGSAGEGYSSGQAMKAMTEIVAQEAPDGFKLEWSGQSREEKTAGDSSGKVFALSLVFVFLCLVALYESLSVPYAVLMTLPIGIFGAFFAEYALGMLTLLLGGSGAGFLNSIYMQIGMIMLVGLSTKNAILIVEFAKVRLDAGMPLLQATLQAARLRLRPILMTSMAFIIGCFPLTIASGAGAAARNGMGVAVVGGMLFATIFGVLLIPACFILVEVMCRKLRQLTGRFDFRTKK